MLFLGFPHSNIHFKLFIASQVFNYDYLTEKKKQPQNK